MEPASPIVNFTSSAAWSSTKSLVRFGMTPLRSGVRTYEFTSRKVEEFDKRQAADGVTNELTSASLIIEVILDDLSPVLVLVVSWGSSFIPNSFSRDPVSKNSFAIDVMFLVIMITRS